MLTGAPGSPFGGGLTLAADSHGVLYVGDAVNRHILVFSAEGRALETIGSQGRGPGEFEAIHEVLAGRGDSLYVFDASLGRLSVFSPRRGHPLAYTVRIATEEGIPYHFFVPADPARGFLFVFRQVAAGSISVHRVGSKGVADPNPVLRGRAAAAFVKRTGSGITKSTPLFGRKPMIGLARSPDRVYYGWSDSLELDFFDLDGRPTGRLRADARSIPVTSRDLKYELRATNALRRKLLAQSEPPAEKPAMRSVFVDDSSRVWVERYTADPAVSEWWVFPADGGRHAVVPLDEKVRLRLVRDGRAYAVSRGEYDVPVVERYRVRVRTDP